VLIAGNWKMFKGPAETRTFCSAFTPPDGVEVVICPPYVSLAAAVESGLLVYAQNAHWESGARSSGTRSGGSTSTSGIRPSPGARARRSRRGCR
jgi:triosephosphate isomerase (TIM)